MASNLPYFRAAQLQRNAFSWADLLILLCLVGLLGLGLRLAFNAPAEVLGPSISLAPGALPWYALLSIGRMFAAYLLSMAFALAYGRLAANNRRAERVMIPLLDVLQSVPILSFLPVVLLSLSAVLPQAAAAEIASIVLIFTSQVWNLAFVWYQSLSTIPAELHEAGRIFRFNPWLRLRKIELPFAAIGLIWNSMMSWAGGWFFLMAAEIFTVGQRDFRLPGLGAYLKEAANQGNLTAIFYGLVTLVLVIIALDQLVWRPLLAWADRFKLETLESQQPPTSWFYEQLVHSRMLNWLSGRITALNERADWVAAERFQRTSGSLAGAWPARLAAIALAVGLGYLGFQAWELLRQVSFADWQLIALGILATLARVAAGLLLALLWTVPIGVAIANNPRLSAVLQPLVQILASIPATALFPIFVLAIAGLPAGLNIAAVLMMLAGSQWYLLFNVIAGANAIPEDLKYTAALLRLSGRQHWQTLTLPALFPYLVTGAITAAGGAWNASIVAEHIEFGGRTLSVIGIGSIIAQATAGGDYPLLFAATASMVLVVVLTNRLFWRRLYSRAEEIYRME